MNQSNTQYALNQCRVLVTATSFVKGTPEMTSFLENSVGEVIYNTIGRPLQSAELVPLMKDIDGFIAGLDDINETVIQAGNRLRVIARYGVGVDRVDLEAATRQKIVVTNTPGANSVAVAELTLGFILALARNLCTANETTRRGEWQRFNGVGLRGKVVGLVGLGAIGREVAVRLQGFNCRILASDPKVTAEQASHYGVELLPLDQLLAQSDFISLHAPVLDSTTGMVNREFLRNTKAGAYLINTARGELIDEAALVDALQSGHLRGAALDCFRKEPPPADHPLLKFPQVIVTPHSGSHTDDAVDQMGWMALKECLAVLQNLPPRFIVNPQVCQDESPK